MRALAEDGPLLVVGDGAVRYLECWRPGPDSTSGWPFVAAPSPAVLARLAARQRRGGVGLDPGDVVPDYRRPADARINWEERIPPARLRPPARRPVTGPRGAPPRGGGTAAGPRPSAVLRIEDRVFDEPWSCRLFEDELAQRTSRAYRAAWVGPSWWATPDRWPSTTRPTSTTFAVAPEWVGRRIGTVLLYDLVHTALARGSAHLTLEVAVGNEPAIALYRRFGLAPVGVRPNYYHDGDALVMWVRDIDSDAYAERLADIGTSLSTRFDLERRD